MYADIFLQLKRGKLYDTIATWPKEWSVSFSMRLGDSVNSNDLSLKSIIQFTTGEICCKHGRNIPGIWLKGTNLYIVTSINDKANQGFESDGEYVSLSKNEFSKVVIEQVAGYRRGGDYIFRVQVDNMLATIMMNSNPMEFTDIKVYTGSTDYAMADVDIKDFEYTPSGSRGSKTANDECK